MKLLHRNPLAIPTCPACPFFESHEITIRPNAATRVIKFCAAFDTEIVTGDTIPEWCRLPVATKEEEKLYGPISPPVASR